MTTLGSEVRVLEGVFSTADCAELLERAQTLGFKSARLASQGRNNSEAFIIDASLADRIAPRLGALVDLVEIDAVFEVYRYLPGQSIDIHRDTGRRIRNEQISNCTIVTYLSEDFTGGYTVFPDLKQRLNPGLGGSIIFAHGVPHGAEKVLAGVKYVVRSDLLVRP